MKGHELIVCKSYKIVANLSQNASQYQCRVTKKLQVKKLAHFWYMQTTSYFSAIFNFLKASLRLNMKFTNFN